MNLHASKLPFLLLLLFITTSNRFPMIKAPFPGSLGLEHIDPTLPPVLPGQTPKCSALVLQQDFGGIVGSTLASANYSHPRECPFPWTRVVLELSIAASEVQKHRIAAVWIDGAEVLRSTTPVPMLQGAAFWKVQKDVTRYSALLRQFGVMYMMLENSQDAYPGVYSANVSLHFYRNAVEQTNILGVTTSHPTIKGHYREPADLILPISNKNGYIGSGFWLMINDESHVATSAIKIPMNAYQAMLEIFVSYHGTDENWYTNPLGASNLGQPSNPFSQGTNGGFRQIYATIDDKFVGGHIPFAVIYPGAINPSFWSPVASIGAFDMPSYYLEVTPFLSLLLDGQKHRFGLGVRDAQPYWLVTANLHLWIDQFSDSCKAELVQYNLPPLKITRNAEWTSVEGESEIIAEGLQRYEGWVVSSKGNLTTIVEHKIKFTSKVEVHNQGLVKQVEMTNKETAQVKVLRDQQQLQLAELTREGPLRVRTLSPSAPVGRMFAQETILFHYLEETLSLSENQATRTRRLIDRQDAEGSTLMLDGNPVWENGSTRSYYNYRDEMTCYIREVNAAGGIVMMDKSASCAAVSDV
ncbi:peptide-N4-(N-acetyl-beta-glucosaminyl)asparagine amidase A-like [Iris pallida]|uniref:Peptide-N4-(N-acetyl-beta-glucosaminyl)asparagine amidase A-like n=1 Tax=Iris pallida TaxID=29817 RepID=A0AAX6I0V5_IRIPA|nr:peptide-N4-(N-acetyl-beta-glucosaminyl)asparagine amidase A-like [Iris pallida]